MKAAFIGLGSMGGPMAMNLIRAGFDLTVYNRTRTREEALAEAGAVRAETPAEAVAGADVIVTCVSDTPDVEKIILGEGGVIEGAEKGAVVVDCSTISPEATRCIGNALAAKGVRMIDAPVSGGTEGAEKGTLAIMVGGAEADVAKAMPVLEAMGGSVVHVGPLGAGQVTKAINQVVIAGTYLGVAEGMVLGLKAGLDMEKVVSAIAGGAAGSWVLNFRSDNMIKNRYPLGFRVKLHRKDLGIALETAKDLSVSMPVASLAAQLENGLIANGNGDEDISALALCIRELSGLK